MPELMDQHTDKKSYGCQKAKQVGSSTLLQCFRIHGQTEQLYIDLQIAPNSPGQQGQDDQQRDVQKNGNPQQPKGKTIGACLHLAEIAYQS